MTMTVIRVYRLIPALLVPMKSLSSGVCNKPAFMKQVLPRFSKPAPTILDNGVRLAHHRCIRTQYYHSSEKSLSTDRSVTAARVRLLVLNWHGSAS